MTIHRRVAAGIRAIAILVVSITISAAILVAAAIDTLTPVSLSASMQCLKAVQPVGHGLALVKDC
jgi:hypothetical protein